MNLLVLSAEANLVESGGAIMKQRIVWQWALAVSLVTTAGAVSAQTDPFKAKPITVIVPFAPGGSADLDTRMYVQKVVENTGWQMLVDFKTGAGGSLGTAFVAKAAPDGHTLVQASAG